MHHRDHGDRLVCGSMELGRSHAAFPARVVVTGRVWYAHSLHTHRHSYAHRFSTHGVEVDIGHEPAGTIIVALTWYVRWGLSCLVMVSRWSRTSTCSPQRYAYRKYPTKGVHPPTSVQIPHSEKKPNGNSSAKAEMGHSWRWTLVGRYFLLTLQSYTIPCPAGGSRTKVCAHEMSEMSFTCHQSVPVEDQARAFGTALRRLRHRRFHAILTILNE